MITQPLPMQVDMYEPVPPQLVSLALLCEAFVRLNGGKNVGEMRQAELRHELFEALSVLALTLKAKDPQLYEHSCRVQDFTRHLAQTLGLLQEEIIIMELGALFHDIGKMNIHTDVLHKVSRLTNQEFEDIKEHPAQGAAMLRQIEMMNPVALLVHHHHERWDGQGYPCGLQAEAIPFGARIVAIADAFAVMTSHRAYQTTRTLAQALEELHRCAGTQFDPVLVDYFCTSLGAYPTTHEPIEWRLPVHAELSGNSAGDTLLA